MEKNVLVVLVGCIVLLTSSVVSVAQEATRSEGYDDLAIVLPPGSCLWTLADQLTASPLNYSEIAEHNGIDESQYRRLPIGIIIEIPFSLILEMFEQAGWIDKIEVGSKIMGVTYEGFSLTDKGRQLLEETGIWQDMQLTFKVNPEYTIREHLLYGLSLGDLQKRITGREDIDLRSLLGTMNAGFMEIYIAKNHQDTVRLYNTVVELVDTIGELANAIARNNAAVVKNTIAVEEHTVVVTRNAEAHEILSETLDKLNDTLDGILDPKTP